MPILGIGTEGFLGDRPRPCKPASASRRDRERLLGGDDAPVKSVCPVGTGIPDDGAGPGSGLDDQLGARADEAPLLHAPVHPTRVPARLAFSLVGLWVPGASRRSSAIF